ncbi:helix-turn-helix domain-containing protein, partial [Streptomyces kanamyceticus]
MPAVEDPGLGKRIAATRRARNKRQADLARDAYLSLGMIRAIEQGKRYPGDTALESIAAALGVDPTRLLAGFTGTETCVHTALPLVSAALAAYDVPLSAPRRG